MHVDDGRVVSNLVCQALAGEDLTIFGDGQQTRAFCYVDDMIEGFGRLMATGPEVTGPINLGNPHEVNILELAETILRLSGSRSRLRFLPLPTDDPRQRKPDIGAAEGALDWRPKVSLEDGLKATIDYFRTILRQ
jgi:UDP-glucuronate decarboxylase